jgi:hypothetical protein
MKKRLLVIFTALAVCAPSALKADFIAYQQLIHPADGTRVHLLFDLHGSIERDAKAAQALEAQVHSTAKQFHSKMIPQGVAQPHIQALIAQIHAGCPNMAKQQQDLIHFVKSNAVSLISEDSEERNRDITDWESLLEILNNIIGYQKISTLGAYRLNVSPLWGFSQALCGRFSVAHFMKIPMAPAYYYNADQLRFGMGGEYFLDNNTLNAVKTLRATYKQQTIIVAEGARHITRLAHTLCSQEGFIAGPMVINEELAKLRPSNKKIDAYLKALERHDENPMDKIGFKADYLSPEADTEYCSLLAHPLDVAATLEEQTKASSEPTYFKKRVAEPASATPVSLSSVPPIPSRAPAPSTPPLQQQPQSAWTVDAVAKGVTILGGITGALYYLHQRQPGKAFGAAAAAGAAWWASGRWLKHQ